jgi:farnesyl-diphosphate farnesyltransferase
MKAKETESRTTLLSDILPRVSRSFSLSIRVLPRSVRQQIGLAYLFCRAADTIADTALLPRELRLSYLDQYRAAFGSEKPKAIVTIQQDQTDRQSNRAERELLSRLPDCFVLLSSLVPEDQTRICELVLTLTQGMQMDLSVFPGETEGRVGALETRADLDRYTYFVAGCVGEFWTRMAVAHLPALQHWNAAAMETQAVRFGKGLQLTNILRDLAQDLRIGRCYLPRTELLTLGVQPEELLDPYTLERVKPLVKDLLELTLSHYREGWAYTLAIPRCEWRLRLACAWPLLIGLSTLSLVRHSPQLLDPEVRLKIARMQVYTILFRSLLSVWSDRALDRYYGQLLRSSDFSRLSSSRGA